MSGGIADWMKRACGDRDQYPGAVFGAEGFVALLLTFRFSLSRKERFCEGDYSKRNQSILARCCLPGLVKVRRRFTSPEGRLARGMETSFHVFQLPFGFIKAAPMFLPFAVIVTVAPLPAEA